MLKATNGTDTVYYTRGFELISRHEGTVASYYLYDGGLSVRALTDESGVITDTLVFDAFGNETEKTGTTANTYGFQGEEKDATGLYYLRARYMDPVTGTFTSMDTYAGSLSDPMSLHKYLFANSNPVMYSDPSGLFSLADIDASMAIDFILNAGYMSGYLYIIDASITDPQLEHHDFTGYLCAIGFGMLFAALNLALSATVAGLLVLAIIDTALGAAGTIKGVIDFINGHKIYGGMEILSSVLLTWFGWRNFASAVNAAKATSVIDKNANTNISKQNNEQARDIYWGKWDDYEHVTLDGQEYAQIGDRLYTEHAVQRLQPSGMRYSSTADAKVGASRILDVGRGEYGRSISPNHVEIAINKGIKGKPQKVSGKLRTPYTSGSVTVITENNGKVVVTIITK